MAGDGVGGLLAHGLADEVRSLPVDHLAARSDDSIDDVRLHQPPPTPIAPATIAFWSAVTSIRSWPNAMRPASTFASTRG